MDLTLDVGEYKLNIRAAGVIIHGNKVLVHKNDKSDHYAIIGGRVEVGEDSAKTVVREITEELGKKVEIIEFMATIENFFIMKGQKYHEIFFMYKVEFENEEDKKIDYPLKNVEGKDNLHYEWLDLDKIDDYKLLPVVVKDLLKKQNYPVHIINYDKK